MVLLSASISGLNVLLNVCERYAATHELRNNDKKSVLSMFKSGTKTYSTLPEGSSRSRAERVDSPLFKYGMSIHIVEK